MKKLIRKTKKKCFLRKPKGEKDFQNEFKELKSKSDLNKSNIEDFSLKKLSSNRNNVEIDNK